ncbi:MAG TPA: TIGR02186 family protein [Kiloniellaceae bacterium]|nr:TIGR02186 family protein [Kiloniellaceae bacterium]
MGRILASVALLAVLAASPLRAAEPLVADLSDHLVAITTGFSGADVLLFGATDQEGDVVVVVRGASRRVIMHRKSRVLGVWVNTASMTFDRVPSFYAVAASRPLDLIAGEQVLSRHELGLENVRLDLPRAKASPNVAKQWRDALLRNQAKANLYQTVIRPVSFLGNRLFRAEFHLPANVPTGAYQVQVYLLHDGRMISAQTTPLIVSKIGLQAEVYDFAQNQGALYGVIAILIALVAGWLGNVAFRRS